MQRSLRTGLIAAALAAGLVAAACGSSVPKTELDAQEAQSEREARPPAEANTATDQPITEGTTPDAGPSSAGTSDAPAGASATAGPSATTTRPAAGVPTGSASRTGKTAAPSAGGPASAASPAAGKSAGANRGSPAASAPAPGGPAPSPGAPPAAPGGPKADIILGSVGTQSGVIGTATLPLHHGAKAWVADVNARGGLAGHKVRLLMADDGGDPNKALALVRRMVEQDKAIALYAEHGPTTAHAILPYLEQKRIPSIAACFCANANAKSPMAFGVGIGSDYGLSWSHILPITAYTNERKVSILFCREAPTCQNMRNRIQEFGPSVKLDIVHEAQVSLAQPDFTAEVLAARNAGAKILVTIMENASVVRIARSAHRQGWFPQIASQGASHDERFLKDGGKDVEGVILGAFTPHWESPKLADYTAAMARYVPGGVKSSLGTINWAGGKLLEVIAPNLPAAPTSEDVIQALYQVNGVTLGGLVPPLTYRPGEGYDKANLCVVPMKVEGGRFVSKAGDEFVCPPGWKPVQK